MQSPYFQELKEFVCSPGVPGGIFENPANVRLLFECIEKGNFEAMRSHVEKRKKLLNDAIASYQRNVEDEKLIDRERQIRKAELIQSREQLQKETVKNLLVMCNELKVYPKSKVKTDIIDALMKC